MKKSKFYSLDKIDALDCRYNLIIGERSNGKTYAVLKRGLENYIKDGSQLAIVRRWQDDYAGKRGQVMFTALESNNEIKKLTGGEWSGVFYRASKWFLCKYDEHGERVVDETPFAYGFALTSMEHDKSTSFPRVTTICFDEFLSRSSYLPDEFILFMNVISTIVRHRTNVKIYMLGNTVNKYAPYFAEMGIKHITNMKQGTIDVYHYGDSELRVAVEYCMPNKDGKESDLYFAFDNPKLQMITGGAWELDIYPHLPCKYKPRNILYIYYIIFDNEILQCEIIKAGGGEFTYIHKKTSEIKDKTALVYTIDARAEANYHNNIFKPTSSAEKKIASFFIKKKVFYQNNEVGEIVRNFINESTK